VVVVRVVGQLEEAGGEVVEAVFHDGEGLHGRGWGVVEGGGGGGEGEVEGDVGCQTVEVSIWEYDVVAVEYSR
jgi:hypothetical protein